MEIKLLILTHRVRMLSRNRLYYRTNFAKHGKYILIYINIDTQIIVHDDSDGPVTD